MLVAYFILQPAALSDSTVVSLSNSALPLVMAAAAETVVLIGGGIDLSVGVVMSLVSVIVATEMDSSVGSMLFWTVAAIGVGCAVGLLNGLLIEYAHVNAFIATLATMEVIQGLALGVLGSPGGQVPAGFETGTQGTSFQYVPNALLIILGSWSFMPWRARPGLPLDICGGERPTGGQDERHPGPTGRDRLVRFMRGHCRPWAV